MATYRSDSDLEFLAKCSNEDLSTLVSILTVDPKDRKKRRSESLTGSSAYKRHFQDYKSYWEIIAAELQTYGGNTLVTTFLRFGKGVLYREILEDVCKHSKVKIDNSASIVKMEKSLMTNILQIVFGKMGQEELNKLAKELNVKNISGLSPDKLTDAILDSVLSNPITWNYLVNIILEHLGFNVGKLVLAAGTTLVPRALPLFGILAGPVGFLASGLWLAADVAGPAYRVTVPACLYVAALRQKYIATNTE